jgi:hypothetical protein
MQDGRKQAVSIRLGASDIRKVKWLAKRLGVRDSDIIRYALKSTLQRVAPLGDPEVRGGRLVALFVENGADLIHHFELDALQLDAIINAGVAEERRVAREDIALIAMAGAQQPYALRGILPHGAPGVGNAATEPAREVQGKYFRSGPGDFGSTEDAASGELNGAGSGATLRAESAR